MSRKKLDLGAISAYALAVEKGYTGTETEFAERLANIGNILNEIQEIRDSFPEDYQTLGDKVDDFIEQIVKIGDEQPSEEYNRIWVRETTEEIELPTMDEFSELENRVTTLEENPTKNSFYIKREDGHLYIETQ